jgi:hypothetical protein
MPANQEPAAGQRLWRPIETAPENKLVLVWDYGSIQIALRSGGKWIGQWKSGPPPTTPTLWLPLPPCPEGSAV